MNASRKADAWLGVVVAISLLHTTGCAAPGKQAVAPDEPRTAPRAPAPDRFTVLTYNVWHGLDAERLPVRVAETPEEATARMDAQIAIMIEAAPDVVLLQEVNPLPQEAQTYIERLAARGYRYTEIHQVDNCGIRLNERSAVFPDLNNGLAILAREELRLRKIVGLRLSGALGECDSKSGAQLEELRYALIGEVTMPGSGERLLVVSTHLHSGFEAGAPFMATLDELRDQDRLQSYAKLRWEIDRGRIRRIGELSVLTRELRKLRDERDYAGIIVGGDLNFEPDFPEHEELRLLRYADTFALARPQGVPYTAVPEQNPRIEMERGSDLPKSLTAALANEDPTVRETIEKAYRVEMDRPRRIDYLFAKDFLSAYCLDQRPFGVAPASGGLPPSDHYGLLNVYTRRANGCP